VVVVGVVIHPKALEEIIRRQAGVLVVAVHMQTRQALLEQQDKDRQVVLVNLVEVIPAAVVEAQRLLVVLQHQILAMVVMAAQGLTGSLLELSMLVVVGLVETVVLLEQADLVAGAMADQMLLVLTQLLILVVAAEALETLLS
jgi:hypothetical protein